MIFINLSFLKLILLFFEKYTRGIFTTLVLTNFKAILSINNISMLMAISITLSISVDKTSEPQEIMNQTLELIAMD